MRPNYDDFDEFDFDDSTAVGRILREERRARRRLASRRSYGPNDADFDAYDFDDSDDYPDYDPDEFDLKSGLVIGR